MHGIVNDPPFPDDYHARNQKNGWMVFIGELVPVASSLVEKMAIDCHLADRRISAANPQRVRSYERSRTQVPGMVAGIVELREKETHLGRLDQFRTLVVKSAVVINVDCI